jgi:hypothetical protein
VTIKSKSSTTEQSEHGIMCHSKLLDKGTMQFRGLHASGSQQPFCPSSMSGGL